MSIVRKTKESHEHKGRRVTLRKLEKEIAGFESVQLGPSELERVKVTTRPMFLDETGMSKFEPCFFRPAQPKLFGAPDDVWFPDYDREPGIQGFEAGPMDRARDLYSYVNEYLLWCYEVGEMTTSRWCSRR